MTTSAGWTMPRSSRTRWDPTAPNSSQRFVTALPGETIEIWERAYDKDGVTNDDLSPTIRTHLTPPAPGGSQQYVVGNGDTDVEMSHTIVLNITDVTPPVPDNGALSFGDPQYGPNTNTQGRLRVSGETPATVDTPAGVVGIEFRVWPEGETPPAWSFDLDGSNGFAIELPDTDSCVCVIEWATIQGSGGDATVSERSRQTIELDNVPPTLVVPDDFSVYANQTAGAKVTYTVTASDDFPGPIDVACSPASGEIFPNGNNAPLVTTAACTATDTVDNQSSDSFDVTVISPVGYVNDYALLGLDWLDVRPGASVASGNVGVFDASTGLPGSGGLEVRVGLDGTLPTDDLIAGDTITIGGRVVAGDVLYADALTVVETATINPYGPCDPDAPATSEPCGYVPLWADLPDFLSGVPGSGSLRLAGAANVLAPGSYGAVELKSNAVATLPGGDYSFASLHLKPGATLRFEGPSTVRDRGPADRAAGHGHPRKWGDRGRPHRLRRRNRPDSEQMGRGHLGTLDRQGQRLHAERHDGDRQRFDLHRRRDRCTARRRKRRHGDPRLGLRLALRRTPR